MREFSNYLFRSPLMSSHKFFITFSIMVLHIREKIYSWILFSFCFCNKLLQTRWLKQHKLLILEFLKSESKMSLSGQKSRCAQGFILVSESASGESVSTSGICFHQASGEAFSSFSRLRLKAPSYIFKAGNFRLNSSHTAISQVFFCFPLSLLRNLVNTLDPHG